MADRLSVDLLTNASATGEWQEWPGGEGRFDLCGTMTSATVTLQVKGCDGTTAHTAGTECTLTATGTAIFKAEAGASIRAHVAGTASDLNGKAYRI